MRRERRSTPAEPSAALESLPGYVTGIDVRIRAQFASASEVKLWLPKSPLGVRCRLGGNISIAAGVPQIAADLLQRPRRSLGHLRTLRLQSALVRRALSQRNPASPPGLAGALMTCRNMISALLPTAKIVALASHSQ